ncbi:TetR/AcrR family transcriptional regulator [Amycolatopsis nigrescens]|uniref:TetR/AcrR family transcriptional regulator n=1 Tax=Amycolatopsis nigrescens TaxID=381445 RepID=UPI00037EC15C|nr:TetR/AcrR family transcriptional regulator [Amycolatopsis nigrescens]
MAPATAKQRLIDTATELFYNQGITATGVDRVVAESGVSKPTLYAHFRSKADLVAAVLQHRHERRLDQLDRFVRERTSDPAQQVLTVFEWLARWHRGPGKRGCAFVNAAVEVVEPDAPAYAVIRAQKDWMRKYLVGLCTDAGARQPDELGAQLMLLVEGANAQVLTVQDRKAADRAKRLAVLAMAEAGIQVTDRRDSR